MRKNLVVVFLGFLSTTSVFAIEKPSLETLENLRWIPYTVTSTSGESTPFPIALSAKGKIFQTPLNIDEVDLIEHSVYDNPLDCYIAGLKSYYSLNEEWYKSLCVSGEGRDANGVSKKPYDTKIDFRSFDRYKKYRKDNDYPRLKKAEVLAYIRVGGSHRFRANAIIEVDKDKETEIPIMGSVEEFRPGLYRKALEWSLPMERIHGVLNGPWESENSRKYREMNPELFHEISINGLYGEKSNAYPLKIMFRGGAREKLIKYCSPEKTVLLIDMRKKLDQFDELLIQLPEDENDYKDSKERKELEKYIVEKQLKKLDRTHSNQRVDLLGEGRDKFVIDLDDRLLSFGFIAGTENINPAYITWECDDQEYKITDLYTETLFKKFLSVPDIWKEIEAVIRDDIKKY